MIKDAIVDTPSLMMEGVYIYYTFDYDCILLLPIIQKQMKGKSVYNFQDSKVLLKRNCKSLQDKEWNVVVYYQNLII